MCKLMRIVAVGVALAGLSFANSADAVAQPPAVGGAGPTAPPAVSPYLNLLRRGTSPGVNYYGLVRPQQEFRNAYRGLQQADAQRVNQAVDARTGLPDTGHAAVFLNTQGYFLSGGSGPGQSAAGQSRQGGGGQQAPAQGRRR